LIPALRVAHSIDSSIGWNDVRAREQPVEHDSVVRTVAPNSSSISERASGSGFMNLYHSYVAPQANQSSFAADVLGNNPGGSRRMLRLCFVSNLVGMISVAIDGAKPVEAMCAASNSQVMATNSCPQGSS
jgi:hypothetical protein